ncbi:hypothetical protein DAPPUDRAFT_243781 [Daphnia pulex]|uniref:Tc1-like transposase DDE domain-containing protein n=1 Tax=Daphnia pulex TaxID=6669 RepID=E9GK42_DAPPU|nr:hypothetical protein DAPPUDRAFT_243781 [Daphnia pulex]|eukprot:EFX80119.1 hypothetical protein DAPPUDRAFT_243781 [Daphnia pulex]
MGPFAEENFALPEVANGVTQEFRFFQHDGCPSHNAGIVQDWLRGEALLQYPIKTLCLPAYSPDLNPIENFWGYMVRKMGQMEANNDDDVVAWVNQIWELMANNQAYWW